MNGITASRRLRFWLGGIAVFAVVLYLLGDVLLPFVVGMAVAYFLDPVADTLEEKGLSRGLAVILILALFFALVVAILILLVPLIQGQVVAFLDRLPGYVDLIREQMAPWIDLLKERFGEVDAGRIGAAAGGYAGDLVSWLGGLIGNLWGGGLALLNLLMLVFITPIAAFYLLRDWDHIVARVDSWLPRDHAGIIREQVRLIDSTLAGFVRGVVTVCLILACFYGLALSLIGLDFGLLIGVFCGLISFIPYLGALTGFVVGCGLALLQFSDSLPVILVAGTFLLGQALEGNVLTPNLVGGRVGLHPAWIIFALLAGATLFGFVGVLLAVPVAAVIGVLGRFAIARYLESPFYLGAGEGGAGPGEGED